ncbi:hypothetical protein TPY_1838 [Sulfobacillus acidophilus TPY]|nr:hypothetical protein TPY_1838 [Sulfobacillus acidophilus TPY]
MVGWFHPTPIAGNLQYRNRVIGRLTLLNRSRLNPGPNGRTGSRAHPAGHPEERQKINRAVDARFRIVINQICGRLP